MNAITPVGWVFTALLLVLVIACVLAGNGTLKRNHLFGVRIPSVLRDDDAWRAGHAAGMLPATIAFVTAMVGELVGLVLPLAHVVTVVAFVAGVVAVLIAASRAAKRASSA
ncbi:SdpI family protein [Leifsonia aquatica]|uniref:SdpI family protein n=1 Tax=Leifsonia aquatica TaxID=144185 RepID=UPI0013B390AA|nr:SdpI family protein [Leifsonia aquatica]